jgi:tetratricopeptide (TPR) repeat protein
MIVLCSNAQNEAQEFFNLGQKEYERGNFINAIAYFHKVVALTHSEWAFYSRGHCKYYARDYFGAIEDMDSVLLINPNNAPALRCRGAAKRMIKLYSEALDDLNKSIVLNANDTTYVNRGWIKLDMKDSAGAMADFNAIIAQNASTPHFLQRARLRTFLKDYNGAFNDYDSAAKVNTDSTDYVIKVSVLWTLTIMKDYSAVIDGYTQLLKRFPNKAEILVNRGNAEDYLGYDGLASRDYRRAAKIEPHNPIAYEALGTFWFGEASYLRSITAYNRAIKINPQNAELYFFRASAKQMLERYSPAIKDFSKAISLNPSYALAYRGRGDAEKALNIMKNAGADYFKATRLGSAKE